jgi:hypothetical protein
VFAWGSRGDDEQPVETVHVHPAVILSAVQDYRALWMTQARWSYLLRHRVPVQLPLRFDDAQ